MKLKPDMEEAGKLAAEGQYRCIPISCELYSDQYTPLGVLRKLKNVSRHCYMLESIEDNQKWDRYTFLGYDPKLELTCINGKLTIKNGSSFTVETGHPGEYIRQVLRENKSPKLPGLPSFTGGLVGYFSYDYMKYAEPALRLNAVDAILPAGTLSGAPKIRACEIINELEDNKRGIYGGAIGYIDFAGNLDTRIAIRIAYKKNGKVFVRSGAGIVADSVPEKEYEECINKAKAVVRALELAQEGIR